MQRNLNVNKQKNLHCVYLHVNKYIQLGGEREGELNEFFWGFSNLIFEDLFGKATSTNWSKLESLEGREEEGGSICPGGGILRIGDRGKSSGGGSFIIHIIEYSVFTLVPPTLQYCIFFFNFLFSNSISVGIRFKPPIIHFVVFSWVFLCPVWGGQEMKMNA